MENLKPTDRDRIIELVANKLYGPAQTDEDFAVQLLVEHLCIPRNAKFYNDKDLREYISQKWDELT